jgi:hypothetical protein
MSTEKKSAQANPVAEVNEALYAAMAMDPEASKEMATAKALAILHAAIRRLPEQTWPSGCQQETTHRYHR